MLEGKHPSRRKECVFLIEQPSGGSDRTSTGLDSYSPRLLEGRQSHWREAEGSAGLLGTEKGVSMSRRRRGHHQQQENCRQKTLGSIMWGQECLKEHIKGQWEQWFQRLPDQGVESPPWIVAVTKKLLFLPLTSNSGKVRNEQNWRAKTEWKSTAPPLPSSGFPVAASLARDVQKTILNQSFDHHKRHGTVISELQLCVCWKRDHQLSYHLGIIMRFLSLSV